MHKEWYEPALARHLDRVAAPEELWDRVRKNGVHTSVNAARVGARGMAMVTALVGILVVAFWLYPSRSEMRSGDASEVRAWVRAKAGVDLPLRQAAGVLVTGARMAKGTVEVAYRVGPRDGRLLVAKGGAAGGHTANSGARVFTWSMDGRTYTLACATPEDLRIACSLCHIG